MTPERWKQIDELAQSGLERAGDERVAFLDKACAGDDALRREVESQIAYQQQASKFLEEPAFKHAAGLIADSQTETESMEGRTISHYSIQHKLGAGGMGEVYLAQDTTLSRKVAIKFLSQNSVAGEQAKKRLVREAKAAAALDHPHICAVHEVGEEAGYSFIVMQYVDGETLASRIQRQPVELSEALDIAVQIADALAEAHSHRIIHRDVKPQNVMLTASGQVKVLDFGLARVVGEGSLIDRTGETVSVLSVPGSVIGTVPYMSPEQVRGEDLDARSDIFSFGVLLYEMISGRNPFQAESVGATMSGILTKDPAPLARYASEAPDELQRIVRKALSKDKEGRYQTIKDMLIDLRELSATTAPSAIAATGQAARSATIRTSSAEYVVNAIKRHKRSAGLTLVMLVIIAAAAIFYFNRATALTEKDTILIADFVNTTGDPVFDGALKQSLAVQLEQSPFLNIFPDERVQQTLRFTRRSPNVRVTRDVAREICERQGLKAMLLGSIASLGSHYVIALDVVNAQTGDVLAREQVEAESKEQVLSVLGKTATRLRERLGESLSTIQKFDAAPEVTTSSLEALKALHAAWELHASGKDLEGISVLKRAVELDAQFALGYSTLALFSGNIGEREAAREYTTRAFELRERASEPEKLWIIAQYYQLVTGELEKAIETQELLKQTYPRHHLVRNVLANSYSMLGQHEKAVVETQEAVRLDPDPGFYRNLARQLRCLGRLEEAKSVLERASAQKLDTPILHLERYANAFLQGDSGEMQSQMEWFRARPDHPWFFGLQTATAEVAGQYRKARESRSQWVELLKRRNQIEAAAADAAGGAQTDALYGHCELVRQAAESGLAIARTPSSLRTAALAFALCGELNQAQSLADEYARLMLKDTLAIAVDLPVIRAAIANHRRNYGQAIELLKTAQRYEHADGFKLPLDLDKFAPYLRGQAFLGQRSRAEAEAEFQVILHHRGIAPFSLLGPLAQLGLARAYVVSGDIEKARKAYEDFFALWKDADADLPILIEAKKEYAGLK